LRALLTDANLRRLATYTCVPNIDVGAASSQVEVGITAYRDI
jgi:hypothetical protein